MAEIAGEPAAGDRARGSATVQEAYAFVCLHCGYGWEQEYEIEHGKDSTGRTVSLYRANGVRVPSPLTRPSCPGCGAEHVRIMRAGRVAEVQSLWHAAPATRTAHAAAAARNGRARTGRWNLHLPFHWRLRNRHATPES